MLPPPGPAVLFTTGDKRKNQADALYTGPLPKKKKVYVGAGR